MFYFFCLVCINVTSFVMYLWRVNEIGEFWHFIEDTTEKRKMEAKKRSTKEPCLLTWAIELLLFFSSAAFVSSF